MRKAAFISGSTRGIGRAVAIELARLGFSVVGNGRQSSGALDSTIAEIKAHGGQAVAVSGDASDPLVIPELLEQAEREIGDLTALVANAGAGPLGRADILDVTPEGLAYCLKANTVGPFFLMQSFAQRMQKRAPIKGEHRSATLVSSANATAASSNKADYCISKAGAAMIAKLFAQKLSPLGVQVVDIRPGVIETDLSAAVIDEYRRRIKEEGLTLFPRVGRPNDIAKAIGCIANGQLPYVTGSVISVDGGLSMERF